MTNEHKVLRGLSYISVIFAPFSFQFSFGFSPRKVPSHGTQLNTHFGCILFPPY
ncbi:hypothetical protein FAM18123_02173 [Lacticaseibacillus paracasei]|nr:hypothetical protein FAM18123_02173 [Lacticaseibacillus paracasei]